MISTTGWLNQRSAAGCTLSLTHLSSAETIGHDNVAGGGAIFVLGLIAFAVQLGWQVLRLNINDPAHCLTVFKSNRDAGLMLFGAMLLDAAI